MNEAKNEITRLRYTARVSDQGRTFKWGNRHYFVAKDGSLRREDFRDNRRPRGISASRRKKLRRAEPAVAAKAEGSQAV